MNGRLQTVNFVCLESQFYPSTSSRETLSLSPFPSGPVNKYLLLKIIHLIQKLLKT